MSAMKFNWHGPIGANRQLAPIGEENFEKVANLPT
jgi:hypothetical protein